MSLSFPGKADILSAGEKKKAKYQQVHYRFWLSSCPVLGSGVGQFNQHGCLPSLALFQPPRLPADIYRGLVCQACCLSVCVTLFLTLPSCSVCLGLCAPAVVFVWQRDSHLASQDFYFFWATDWPSGICRFLYIFLTPFFKVRVPVWLLRCLDGQLGSYQVFIFGWFVLPGLSLMVASCALVARRWLDIRRQ